MAQIGTDEWVSEAEERRLRRGGALGAAARIFARIGPGWSLAILAAFAAIFPLAATNDFMVRVGVNVLLLAMLALGLNVVVGWAGLLDLGYVAFYGLGAYMYAFLASGKFDIHLPTPLIFLIVIAVGALAGFILGLPSRRLTGDYLAIMTLFFAQVFVELANNLDRIRLPWADAPLNLTGGPNGIPGVDRMEFFGFRLTHVSHYFYLLLILLVALIVALHNVDRSRTGRAWKSLREDTLAAQQMTMPVKRLKLLAYMFGAATAALTGTVFAAVQVGVFPQNFEVTLLITIYAALILGGAGSIPGAIAGAIVIGAVPEILRTPDAARWMFYLAVLVALVAIVRPWQRFAALVAATAVFGVVVGRTIEAIWGEAVGRLSGGGIITGVVGNWVVILRDNQDVIGNYAFLLLMVAVLALTQIKGWSRFALLVPTIYLAAFVWENRLVLNPSITRQMLFGAILVVMMAARPQGLLGRPRVEIL